MKKDDENTPIQNTQDEPNGEPALENGDDIESLRQQVGTLMKENEELFQKLQRLSADYANFQKRAPRQIADSIAYEKEAIIKSLLPALDNFDQAIANSEKEMTLEAMQKGVKIVYSHLLDILKSQGVEVIESKGKRFDPALHQAMMQQEDPKRDDGVILEEFQKGYKLCGRVIRPARVIVNKLSGSTHTPDQEETTDTQ